MHIPEGMLSIPVTALAGAISLAAIAHSVTWVRRHLDERRVVLMAVLGALIFALQMLNFPIQAGTSGHFAGGALAGILLGPWPAVLVLTTVLAVQAFLFADGGVIALGANILNLGILAPLIGHAVYRLVRRFSERRAALAVGAFLGAWLSIVAAALAVAGELGLSGTAHPGLAALAMGGTHAIIGIGEGLVTAALVAYLLAVRPDLLEPGTRPHPLGSERQDRAAAGRPLPGAVTTPTGHPLPGAVIAPAGHPLQGAVIALGALAVLAAALSFLASSAPDGLEWVYFEQGIGNAQAVEQAPRLLGDGGPLADYQVAGLDHEGLGSAIAGLTGLAIVGMLLAAVARRRRGAAVEAN